MVQKSSGGIIFNYLIKLANAFLIALTFPLTVISKLENAVAFLANVFKPFQILGKNVIHLLSNLVSPCIALGTALGELYVKCQIGFHTVGKVVASNLYMLFYMSSMLVWNIFARIIHVLFATKNLFLRESARTPKHGIIELNFKRSS